MSWDYIEVYVNHPHHRKRPNGCVLEHILVAEKTLGRFLNKDEVVHHIDENKKNNSPNNLMVFKSQADHTRFHMNFYEDVIEYDDGSWECTPKIQICNYCMSEFNAHTEQQYCSNTCKNMSDRRCDRPSKDELLTLLRKYPFTRVGEIFNVSDNAIRKWCKGYNMSTRAKDYR